MTSMLQRIAAAAACALLLVGPASAQLIGSGHVMGNGSSSPAAPTDTQLLGVMNQTGSGIASGVGAVLVVSPNVSGGVATLGAAPVNGNCASFNSSGKIVPAGGACGTGTGSGTVTAGTQGQIAGYAANGPTVVGIPPTCIPIELFGGGIGVSSNDVAFNAEIAAFNALTGTGTTKSGCMSFGAGKYSFTTAPTAIVYSSPTQSIAIEGAGSEVTTLDFGAIQGIVFSTGYAAGVTTSFHVRHMSINTSAGGSGQGLTATYLQPQSAFPPMSDITDVTFRGDDISAGTPTEFWSTAIRLNGVSYVNIEGVNVYGKRVGSTSGTGIGISISGDVAISSYGVIFNIDRSNLAFLSVGLQYGDFVQGVTVSNTNINFNTVGVNTVASPLGLIAGYLSTNSNYNNYGNNFATNGHIGSVQFTNNLFIIFANTAGIICNPCDNSIFTGNTFSGASTTGTTGLVLEGTNNGPITSTSNIFSGLALGMEIVSPATNVNIQSNAYLANTANVFNSGTIKAGSCAGISGTCVAGATP